MEKRMIAQNKIETVEKLSSILEDNKGIALFKDLGINTDEINLVRKKIRANEIKAVIAKNTLWKIALNNVNKNIKNFDLEGKMVGFYGVNAIDALGAYNLLGRQEKLLLSPVCIIDKTGVVSDSNKIKNISKVKNFDQFVGSCVMVLRAPVIKLIKILDIAKDK